jgi:hypothetical protein
MACPTEEVPDAPPPTPEPTPEPTPAGPPPLAKGLEIAAVTINQGVEGRLVRGFSVLFYPTVPVVAGRGALIRVHVAPTDDWDDRVVVATLQLTGIDEPMGDDDDSAEVSLTTYTDTKEIVGFSDSAELESTFNFELPPEAMQVGVGYFVEIREVDHEVETEGESEGARMPPEDDAPLHASDWGGVLRIEIIPVQNMGDGSGRVPTLDEERIAVYTSWFERMWPVRDVQITVGEVYVSEIELLSDGTGYSETLEAMSDLRDERGIPWERYVYGMLAPAEEDQREQYCAAGCTLGLGYRAPNPNNAGRRVSVGASFEPDRSARTLMHEVGHSHDRGHADCGGAGNVDPNYPYSGGRIGSWGWDLQERVLLNPNETVDLMAYCSPSWFSDYTYEALWDRIVMLEGLGEANGRVRGTPETWRVVSVRPDGSMILRGVRELTETPSGEAMTVVVVRDGVKERVEGVFWAFDHLDGGTLLLPDPSADIASVQP